MNRQTTSSTIPTSLRRRAIGPVQWAAIAALGLQLTACGGGADTDNQSLSGPTDVTAQAARSVELSTEELAAAKTSMRVGNDAMMAVDSLLLASAKVTPPTTPPTTPPNPSDPATASKTVNCPTSGSVTLTIKGTLASIANPKPNADEIYDLSFAQCVGLLPGTTLNGEAEIHYTTVDSSTNSSGITHTESSGSWSTSSLAVTGANGTVVLTGTGEFSSVSDLDDSITGSTSTTVTSPSLTLTVNAGSYSASPTLNAVSLTRTANLSAGVTTSSSLSGSFQLVMPGSLPAMPVSIYGSLTYTSTGSLSSGSLGVMIPKLGLQISQSAGVTTLSIDRGADGTIDRVITLP